MPGDVVCQSGWDSCSDGKSYSVECTATNEPDYLCKCLVNGKTQTSMGALPIEQTFSTAECPMSTSDVNQPCGWNLQ
jgi:hypothetical protein